MDPVLTLLHERLGWDPGQLRADSVQSACRRIAEAHGLADDRAFASALQRNNGVWQALVEQLVVPETWFFRLPEALGLLLEQAEGRLAGGRHTVRILSLPCASGEEPYSIAISLLRAGIRSFEITASDVSRALVEKAAAGEYRKSAFREPGRGAEAPWFEAGSDGFQVSLEVRSKVRLIVGDCRDVLARFDDGSFDFVFCRNFLIYLAEAAHSQVIGELRRVLRDDGVLFLGSSEVVATMRSGFVPLRRTMTFACAKTLLEGTAPSRSRKPPRPRLEKRKPRAPQSLPLGQKEPERQAPALPTLEHVRSLADRGKIGQAADLLVALRDRMAMDPEFHYWNGVIKEAAEEAPGAEQAYRKALYLDPGHLEARAHLALLLDAQGRAGAAQRLRRVAKEHSQ